MLDIQIKKSIEFSANNGKGHVEVLLILKDVTENDFNKKYNILSKLSDACLANDFASFSEECEDALKNPYIYGKSLSTMKEKIKNTIKTLSEYLFK